MKRVGVICHAERAEAAQGAAWLARTLIDRGIEVWARPEDAAKMGEPSVTVDGAIPDELDLVFAFGGDGTLLHAAALIGDRAPLLGVNFGHLGFLSELERADLESGLHRVLDSGFDVEERIVLAGRHVSGDRVVGELRAVNDVIVAKTSIGRAIRIGVSVSGEPLVGWAADGVIVATSTGSTAYSFSSGGPVVSPRLDCFVITPVSAHGLFARSIVVPGDEEITLRVLGGSEGASMSADGRPETAVGVGDEVVLAAAPERVRLAKVDPTPFWGLVREKFRLPEIAE